MTDMVLVSVIALLSLIKGLDCLTYLIPDIVLL